MINGLVDQLNKWSDTAEYCIHPEDLELYNERNAATALVEVILSGEAQGRITLSAAVHSLVCLVGARSGEFNSADVADALCIVAYYMRRLEKMPLGPETEKKPTYDELKEACAYLLVHRDSMSKRLQELEEEVKALSNLIGDTREEHSWSRPLIELEELR